MADKQGSVTRDILIPLGPSQTELGPTRCMYRNEISDIQAHGYSCSSERIAESDKQKQLQQESEPDSLEAEESPTFWIYLMAARQRG